jgi:hypothetical protein
VATFLDFAASPLCGFAVLKERRAVLASAFAPRTKRDLADATNDVDNVLCGFAVLPLRPA